MALLCLCIILLFVGVSVQDKLKPGDVLSFVESKDKVHIVFLLDSSGSITVDDWALMKHGMNVILQGGSSDNVISSLISFSDNADIVYSERPMESTKQKCIEDVNKMPQTRGHTNLGKGLTTASVLLQKYPNHKKIVVLFTDGMPTDDISLGVSTMKQLNCRIISIGFGQANQQVLTKLSGADNVMMVHQLSQFVNELNSHRSKFSKDEITIEASVPSHAATSPSGDFEFKVTIKNYGESPIPGGCVMKFSEVLRFVPQRHFSPKNVRITKQISENDAHSFMVKLDATAEATDRNLPQHISYTLKCPSLEIFGLFKLQSNFFVNDIISMFQGHYSLINLLLVGPVGSGKTTTKNLLMTSLTNVTERVAFGVEGSGTRHTTNHTITKDIRSFHLSNDNLANVELRITDTKGIDGENFNNGFMGFLLDGIIADGEEGASGLEAHKNRAFNRSSYVRDLAHVVIFVVKHNLADASENDTKLINLRNNVEVAKSKHYSPLLVVTHMGSIKEENWNPTLATIAHKLGINAGDAFPINLNPNSRDRTFESDMQALAVLRRALENAQRFIQAHQKITPSSSYPWLLIISTVVLALIIRWAFC
eukprot:Phypoly_transcript_05725.p1 GENE.Phypoly_transcript_05725~~Phypoly_transcript_05725.p1  ORF type:complete len:595 (+),score=71.80 Phypoly_transcript_05725:87-1871(+)